MNELKSHHIIDFLNLVKKQAIITKKKRIRLLRFAFNEFEIHYDADYGMDKKTGWSIAHKGHFIVELEKWLIIALYKFFKTRNVGLL